MDVHPDTYRHSEKTINEYNYEKSPLLSDKEYLEDPCIHVSIDQPAVDTDLIDDKIQHQTYWECFFVTLPVFSGYACLFALRHDIMLLLNIHDNASSEAQLFNVAASLVYLGNLIFRLGHNLLFAPFTPRYRVLISMVSMFISIGLIASMFLIFKENSRVWMVFVAYGLGGLGIGTFESNLLASITPIGKENKFWAILGIPVGVNLITIGGYAVISLGVPTGYVYLATLVALGFGIAAFMVRIFRRAGEAHAVDLLSFILDLARSDSMSHFIQKFQLRNWVPQIIWPSLALMLDMFFLSLLSPGAVIQNLYKPDQQVHFGLFNKGLVFRYYVVIYSVLFFVGDTSSRKIFYNRKYIFPITFLVFCLVSGALFVSAVTELVLFAGLFAAFANGSIYAQASRMIDQRVPKKHHLIALSFWLFIGDIGSVVGSLQMQNITNLYVKYR